MGGLGLLTVAFPLFAVEHLGVERSAAGYMWAAFAVGSTLGALSLVRIQRRFPPERIVLTGYAVFGLLMLSWPLAGSLPVFLALVALAALVDGPALAAQFAHPPAARAAVALRAGVHDRGGAEGRLVRARSRAGAGWSSPASARPRRSWWRPRSRWPARRGGRDAHASSGSSGPRCSCSPERGS